MKLLLRYYDDDLITMLDPMIQTKFLLIIKGLKTFKKGTLS